MKDFLFLFTLVLLCGYGCTHNESSFLDDEAAYNKAAEEKGRIQFSPAKGYTKGELEVLEVAEVLANKLVASSCFENFMVNRNLIQTNNKSRAEVVKHLRYSHLAVPVVMYYRNNNVVGYRQPPSITIYTNRKFHAGSTACARGSNLTHEWSHALGYGHTSRATYSRPRSVPYSINAAFQACCSCKGIKECSIKGEQ